MSCKKYWVAVVVLSSLLSSSILFAGPQEDALWEAVSKGSVEKIAQCLEKGANIDVQGRMGMTPLMLAAMNYKKDIVEFLLRKGANVNVKGDLNSTALTTAMTGSLFRERLSESQKVYKEIMELLVRKGAKVNVLLDLGESSTTPLAWALGYGDKDMVRLFLDKGADVNTQLGVMGTVLFHAMHDRELTELLLSRGADVNVHTQALGETPLMVATWKGTVEVVELLLANGADIDARDNYGDTALMYAVYYDKKEMVELLLSQGANVNLKDHKGRTALMGAQQKDSTEMIDLLKKAGAK